MTPRKHPFMDRKDFQHTLRLMGFSVVRPRPGQIITQWSHPELDEPVDAVMMTTGAVARRATIKACKRALDKVRYPETARQLAGVA